MKSAIKRHCSCFEIFIWKSVFKFTNLLKVTGVYEGGLKIWECSIDLASFLTDQNDDIGMSKLKVLELGCGAGIPGIVMAILGAGANEVHFQVPALLPNCIMFCADIYLVFLCFISDLLTNNLVLDTFWLSWQSSCFQQKSSMIRIQSSTKCYT